jgi:hypothetical protein
MTIEWDRLDNMALLPEDSSVVTPPPITTIAWTPMLGPTIFDYDPSDMVVTPGAGEEVAPPAEGGTPPAGEAPGGPTKPSRPGTIVAARRSKKLFLKEGLIVNVDADAPARVRAVLRAKVPARKGKPYLLNLTKVLTVEVGTEPSKLTLHPSRGGRRALARLDGPVSATLVMVFRYGPGFDPVHVTKHVTITG